MKPAIERDRRSKERREADADVRDRLNKTTRQLRTALNRIANQFDIGYAQAISDAALLCCPRCDQKLDNLRAKVRRPQEVPQLARGTRELNPPSEADTVPIEVVVTDVE